MTKKVVTILKDMDCLMSTTELINQSGFSHEIKITDCRTIESNYYLSQQLNVPLATKLFYLCRERIVDGIPSVIEKNYVPYSFVPGIEKLDFSGSYYARLKEKYNIMISVSEEELLIVNAKDDEIAMLNIPNGSEILLDKGLSYVSEKRDKPFEYFEIVSLPSFFSSGACQKTMSEKKAIYVQLMDSIKKKIVDGELSIGERLPSERNMSQVYGINRLTVRNALKKLEEEGILISKPQSGYYVERVPEVVEKIDLSRKGILSLSMQIKQSGMIPSRITLSLRRLKPVDVVGEFFPNEKEVYEIIRLCRIYDEPYALQFVYIPTSKFDDAERFDFESFSLYDYMADKGHRPKEVISKLSIGTISPDYYRIMHYNKNFFICEYTGFDINDEPVEYTLSYFNPKYTSFKYNIKA